LLDSMEKVGQESRLAQKQQQPKEEKRHIRVNLMRLQDKQFHIQKNIYNIAVGQIFSRENYLADLSS
jgi:hypothetical protein